MTDPGEVQVLVKFVTKLAANLRVPETPVAVPANLRRYALSQIINHLLALEPQRPFDFLVNGELVRKSLQQHLLEHNLSAESLLVVEYIPAVVPPTPAQSSVHDDWVSAVACCTSGHAVSGSYDGNLRIWDGDLECVASCLAHTGGVNCVAPVSSSLHGSGRGDQLVASAGKDATVRLWHLKGLQAGSEPSTSLVATYHGHTDAVECVASNPDGTRLLSCGWDGSMRVWEVAAGASASADAADGDGNDGTANGKHHKKKKRKVGAADGAVVAVATGGQDISQPVAQLVGHIHCVSSAAWASQFAAFSGGWDHSVRRWDVETAANTDTYNGSKTVLAVACRPPTAGSGGSSSVVAFGGSDRSVRLWDCRSRQGEELQVKAYGGHHGWVAALSWCGGSEHHLASASYDGSVKVWDLRTFVPLVTLERCHGGEKLLALAWSHDCTALLSGGADRHLRAHRFDSSIGGPPRAGAGLGGRP